MFRLQSIAASYIQRFVFYDGFLLALTSRANKALVIINSPTKGQKPQA